MSNMKNRLGLHQHVQIVDFLKKNKAEIENLRMTQFEVAKQATEALGFGISHNQIAYCAKKAIPIKWRKKRLPETKFIESDGFMLEKSLRILIKAIVECGSKVEISGEVLGQLQEIDAYYLKRHQNRDLSNHFSELG